MRSPFRTRVAHTPASTDRRAPVTFVEPRGRGRTLDLERARRLGHRVADVLPERVQRDVPQKKISEGVDKVAITNYIAAFDTAVQKAFNYVLHKPSLPDFGEVDSGHLRHWSETWASYLSGASPPLAAAAFGYAVEALTELIFLPDPPFEYR